MKTCALCFNPAEHEKLCRGCYADWVGSIDLVKQDVAEGKRGVLHNTYETQEKYIEEFFARVDRVGMEHEEARRLVTESHAQDDEFLAS